MLFDLPVRRKPRAAVIAPGRGNLNQLCREVAAAVADVEVSGYHSADSLRNRPDIGEFDILVLDERAFLDSGITAWFQFSRQHDRRRLVPVIAITDGDRPATRVRLIEAGADLLLHRPVAVAEFRAAVDVQLQRKYLLDELEYLERVLLGFIHAVEARDPYTAGHTVRVTILSYHLAEALDLTPHEKGVVLAGGLMHDVGKIGVPDSILRKPAPLNAEEFAEVQRHPEIGVSILSPLLSLKETLPAIRNHHERWDGKGYPDRLAGVDIPLVARVISVADSIEAMLSDRPYREGFDVEKVERLLIENRGAQWDPLIVDTALTARTVHLGKRLVTDKRHVNTTHVTPSLLREIATEFQDVATGK